MATYQREESMVHWVTIRDRNNALYDPDTIAITITDPCGSVVTDAASMTSDSTGVYYYSYLIPADAYYGEYLISVTATSAADVTISPDKFFILPWDITDQVRKLSGITSKKSINDDDIAFVIWEAYQGALDEVYQSWYNEAPNCNPNTGAWFDGSNTTFATKHVPLADHDGNGVIHGWGEASCGTDIDGWWQDSTGNCHHIKITVNDAKCGNITITQLDGTAIPNNAKWVTLDYYTEWETYNERIFRLAVSYLAAHKCIERFHELGRATLADLHSNKQVILAKMDRMLINYKKEMKRIKKPVIGASMLPGE